MTRTDREAISLRWRAFVIRAFCALTIHFFAPAGLFAPDELTYSQRGERLANYLSGTMPTAFSLRDDAVGYYYVVAFLYLPFGVLPLLPKLVNAWVGSLVVLELYRLTKLMGGAEAPALRAAQFMAYFPSQILWSSVMVRDVWVQWLLMRLAREMAELKGIFIPSRIISAVALVWLLTQFRPYLLYAVAGPFVLSFFLGRSKDLVRNLSIGALLAISLAYADVRGRGTSEKVQNFDLAELQRLRSWSSSEAAANSGFENDADISTPEGALSFLPIGLAYFFFAPFPWQLGSLRQSLAIPETVYFYTLVPGIIAGIIYLLRRRLVDSVGVLLVTMTVTFGYAIGQGNVGTLYRHKAQVIGFYYAFAAIGADRRRKPAGVPQPSAYPAPPGPLRTRPAAAYSS